MDNKNYLSSKAILSLICDDTDGITAYNETDNILDEYEPYYNSAIEDLMKIARKSPDTKGFGN